MKDKIKLLTGMHDILPDEVFKRDYLEKILAHYANLSGYKRIITPILEKTALFKRTLGDQTDIIGKEMYSFQDLDNDYVCLRPEGTASVVRAVVEHNLLYNSPQKFWYYGPMFRREKPQKGRYRQFYQFGIEALGYDDIDIEIEILSFLFEFWKKLGINNHLQLQINSLGTLEERNIYKEELISYLKKNQSILDKDSQNRLLTNPLRILDSKNKDLIPIISDSPKLINYLNENSLKKYEKIKAILNSIGISYQENLNLVRGLDYYNNLVFEWITDVLGSQGTICAGGRYNGLTLQLGGKDYPGFGFALGIDRLLLLLDNTNYSYPKNNLDFFLISFIDNNEKKLHNDIISFSINCMNLLRKNGYSIFFNNGNQKIKTQFKKADISGAKYAIIIGKNELLNNSVTIKNLRSKEDNQDCILLDNLIDYCIKKDIRK